MTEITFETEGYPITDKHFQIYKRRVKIWLKRFGLVDWKPYFDHTELIDDAYAMVEYDPVGRTATFSLNTTHFETKPTDKDIDLYAFHEVCELLLGKIKSLSMLRSVRQDEIDEAVHAIIRRMENAIFYKTKRKKNAK